MASVDTNDFTVRTHLGVLHYASSIYTCAFTNLSNQKKSWKWLVNEFVNIFSVGVLQINFMANLTLMDHKEPMAERVFYLDRARSAKIVTKQNSKFNPM